MTFRIALSGLNAAQADLNVTANNIANTSTNGFKGSRTEFADLFAVSLQGVSSNQSGNGVKVASVSQQFAQGNIEFTDSNLDLAISGQGMFVLSDKGALSYTRAGAYQMDNQGYVVNTQGQRLQVYPPLAAGGFNTGGLGDLRLQTTDSAPKATDTVNYTLNLPGNASPPPTAPFDPNNPNTFNQATSLTLYDSLGATHTGTMYFSKTATANQWDARLYIDGTAVGAAQTLQYSSSGILQTPVGGLLPFPAYTPTTGAAAMNVTVNMSQSTQYGNSFAVNAVTQDGYTTGRLIGIDISDTGIVNARFTNGNSTPLGQIAVANFANAQGLQQLGNTQWAETFASGQALRGQAGNSGFGLVQSGALESANVDVTEQLVNMMTAQRNFQANAQMISTADQITQTIIQMR
ncbi:MAG TPA: flagellar hook protein FlgE [Steroidobacteraceae bacterium]|jgi:flagellar hook protein FlgE|nr:flagellar hook protein FlgE [Steroidobacteraceae bacterium]